MNNTELDDMLGKLCGSVLEEQRVTTFRVEYARKSIEQLISTHYISKSKVLEAIGEDEYIEVTDPDSFNFGEEIPSPLNDFREELRTKLGLEKTE